MLLVAMSLKLVAEVALLALLGRWVLGRLAGPQPQHNPFWRLLDWVVAPASALTGWLGGRRLSASRRAGWTVLLLLLVWLLATVAKIALCLRLGVQACR